MPKDLILGTGERLEYYTATWCAPCKIFGPIVEEVTKELQIWYDKIVIDSTPELIPPDVMGVPTVIKYKDDIEVGRIVGARTAKEFQDWLMGVN